MTRALTAVFAHPDDETYASGATLAKYSAVGVRCSLYCATDGDAGRASGIRVTSRQELARRRREELRAACTVLGVQTVECGGHPDGLLARSDLDRVIGEIVALIRQERPDVLITFGPEGAITQHSDHRAISRLATAAHLLAGTTSAYPEQLTRGVRPHRATRLCYVTWLPPTPDSVHRTEGQPCHVQIDARPWNARKNEAFLAHATQREHQANFQRDALTDLECYFVASGAPMPEGSSDLFAAMS